MNALTLSQPRFIPSRSFRPRRFRAFGLLEVILVFAIIIGAAASTFAVFTPANASAKASDTAARANTIIANLRGSSWGLAHDYTGLTPELAIKAGVVPKAMVVDGEPTTAYGPIWVGPYYSNNRRFDINMNNIPDSGAECSKLLASFGTVGLDDVLVAGSGPMDMGGSVFTDGKLDMTKVGFWCSGENTSNGSVGIDLVGH